MAAQKWSAIIANLDEATALVEVALANAYDTGYRDGESFATADWQSQLDESGLFEKHTGIWPADVIALVNVLEERNRLLQAQNVRLLDRLGSP